jgi:hypothetical protein
MYSRLIISMTEMSLGMVSVAGWRVVVGAGGMGFGVVVEGGGGIVWVINGFSW